MKLDDLKERCRELAWKIEDAYWTAVYAIQECFLIMKIMKLVRKIKWRLEDLIWDTKELYWTIRDAINTYVDYVKATWREPSTGFGDTIAKITKTFGVKPCANCEKRKVKFNEMIKYQKIVESKDDVDNLDLEPEPVKAKKTKKVAKKATKGTKDKETKKVKKNSK